MSEIEEGKETIEERDQEEIIEEPDEVTEPEYEADKNIEESGRVREKNDTVKEKSKKEGTKEHTLRFVIMLVLAAVVVLGVYLHLTNNSKNSERQAEENLTETEILKNYDFANQYPKQARDVVKLYYRYLKCMYNERFSEEELERLNTQVRELYCEALLAENDEAVQFSALQQDVENFHTAGKIFIGYTVVEEENVQYSSVDGAEYAIVNTTCNIKESGSTNTLQMEYLLVKENDQWKIVGWQEIITN